MFRASGKDIHMGRVRSGKDSVGRDANDFQGDRSLLHGSAWQRTRGLFWAHRLSLLPCLRRSIRHQWRRLIFYTRTSTTPWTKCWGTFSAGKSHMTRQSNCRQRLFPGCLACPLKSRRQRALPAVLFLSRLFVCLPSSIFAGTLVSSVADRLACQYRDLLAVLQYCRPLDGPQMQFLFLLFPWLLAVHFADIVLIILHSNIQVNIHIILEIIPQCDHWHDSLSSTWFISRIYKDRSNLNLKWMHVISNTAQELIYVSN
jgi:hypothetical protein